MKKSFLTMAFIGIVLIIAMSSMTTFKSNDVASITLKTDKTDSFKVYGNCGMCKKTIEGSLKGIKGIKSADWDKVTKMMVVTYSEDEITLLDIKNKIAKVGYDSDEVRASDKVYNKLHGCCQYERPAPKTE